MNHTIRAPRLLHLSNNVEIVERPETGTATNKYAYDIGELLKANPDSLRALRFQDHVIGRTDPTGLAWLRWPIKGFVQVRHCPTLRGAFNAFLRGYGAHSDTRVLWSSRDLSPSIAYKIAGKWRTRDWAFDKWVPVMPGRLSTQLAFTMFQRGDQPRFTTVAQQDVRRCVGCDAVTAWDREQCPNCGHTEAKEG